MFREVNMNYFEIGKFFYPAEWRTLLWSQDLTVSIFFEMVLTCLFDIINYYLFVFKQNKSLGTSRKYFMVEGSESVPSLFTNSSLISVSFTLFSHDLKIRKQFIQFETYVLRSCMVLKFWQDMSKFTAPSFLGPHTFYMNTSGVKTRPTLKKFMIFNSYSRERENLNTFFTLVLIYKEPVYEKTSTSTSKKLRNFWNCRILW